MEPDKEEIQIPLSIAMEISEDSPGFKVLKVLQESDDELTVSDVAEQLELDKGHISRTARQLEDLGLLTRQKDSGKYGSTKLILEQ